MSMIADGPKLERIPDYYIEPINMNSDDSRKNRAKTSFSGEKNQKRRKSAFNKHPREYSDVYDINLVNEDSPLKNGNDQIKRQLLGLNKKGSSIEKASPYDNPFGSERERLQNQLNDLVQAQINLQAKAERERKFYEDKKKQLQVLIDETNPEDFYELHAKSVEKKKKIVELECKVQNKEKERLKEQKEYYDELNKAVSLKNLLIKEIKEMIEMERGVPSFKEGTVYPDPIELIKSSYLRHEECQDSCIDDHIETAEIRKTNAMPTGLKEDITLSNLQMNATEKYFFDLNKENSQRTERSKGHRKEMLQLSKRHPKSQSQPQISARKDNTNEEDTKPTVLLRDIYQDDDL